MFPLGTVYATPLALEALQQAGQPPIHLLSRHLLGDWGELCEEDWKQNDAAILAGQRLLSSYRLRTGVKVWVITEWDRKSTTLLLPEEY